MPKVTMIPATVNPLTHLSAVTVNKRRVAGYARVSTDKDEQFTSYEAQVDYYTKYIKNNPQWTFVSVYTYEGISGTNTKNREGFNRMIADALAGKIDLIVTKSVSRFARNTVDSLVTIRKLKEHGVECFFEKENIYTFDGKGELLITIMSSLAQEESRSISENVTWGQRKRFADGKISLPYSHFLGYERGADGLPQVVEKEAEVVRLIYSLFLDGKTPASIATILTNKGIPTPAGKSKWYGKVVESILTNEKYRGDALLQKKFTVDFLTKKQERNNGQIPQFYVEGSHEPIVSIPDFEAVQAEMARRKALGRRYTSTSCFSSKLVCGDCGGFLGSKVWHSTDKYKRTIWQCNGKFEHGCLTPHLYEDDIKRRFTDAFNELFAVKNDILRDCRTIRDMLSDCTEAEKKLREAQENTEVIGELIRKYVQENASASIPQDEFSEHYVTLTERYKAAAANVSEAEHELVSRRERRSVLQGFISGMAKQDEALTDFSETLWNALIEKAVVSADCGITFCFKKGMTVKA